MEMPTNVKDTLRKENRKQKSASTTHIDDAARQTLNYVKQQHTHSGMKRKTAHIHRDATAVFDVCLYDCGACLSVGLPHISRLLYGGRCVNAHTPQPFSSRPIGGRTTDTDTPMGKSPYKAHEQENTLMAIMLSSSPRPSFSDTKLEATNRQQVSDRPHMQKDSTTAGRHTSSHDSSMWLVRLTQHSRSTRSGRRTAERAHTHAPLEAEKSPIISLDISTAQCSRSYSSQQSHTRSPTAPHSPPSATSS
mmetsp:Transcript_18184/g.51771  ORF Transcript_18184/g.51771 Transcript_18184/m.51771 type:complete len:249 (-) Transcript_18184:395-1141(-)